MGAPTQRVGDANTGGGVITSGVDSVVVEGSPISVNGDPVSPHGPYPDPGSNSIHQHTNTQASQSSVFAGGKPVVKTGDSDTCGHSRTGGASSVIVV